MHISERKFMITHFIFCSKAFSDKYIEMINNNFDNSVHNFIVFGSQFDLGEVKSKKYENVTLIYKNKIKRFTVLLKYSYKYVLN